MHFQQRSPNASAIVQFFDPMEIADSAQQPAVPQQQQPLPPQQSQQQPPSSGAGPHGASPMRPAYFGGGSNSFGSTPVF